MPSSAQAVSSTTMPSIEPKKKPAKVMTQLRRSVRRGLGSVQRALRKGAYKATARERHLLLPAAKAGPEFERFHDPSQTLVSWDTKSTQWWYFTGHLEATNGQRFGFEVCFFERRTDHDYVGMLAPRVFFPKFYIAHFALTVPGREGAESLFRFHDRGGYLNPSGFASSERVHVEVGNWHVRRDDDGTFHLYAEQDGDRLTLALKSKKPPVFHAAHGYSQKGDDSREASFYCSYTRLEGSGRVEVGGSSYDVRGTAWMDHEKMSLPNMQLFHHGWDWFSIQLDGEQELMAYMLKDETGGWMNRHSAGTWVRADGTTQKFNGDAIRVTDEGYWTSPVTQGRYPVRRRLTVEPLDLELVLEPVIDGQELDVSRTTMVAYWEGQMRVTGTLGGQPVSGMAYMELVGFDRRRRSALLKWLTSYSNDHEGCFELDSSQVLGVALASATVDGALTPAERGLISRWCENLKLSNRSRGELAHLEHSPPSVVDIASWARSMEERRAIYAIAEEMAGADGAPGELETSHLSSLASALGLNRRISGAVP